MIEVREASCADVDAVILDPEIYDRISDDTCPPREAFRVPYNQGVYLAGFVNNRLASLFVVHDGLMHFMVMKHSRLHAGALLEASMKVWKAPARVAIATLYRSVINFAWKHGFRATGLEKGAFVKNGVAYDRVVMERG